MSDNLKKNIVWAIRILSAGLFVLSAVGKLSIDAPFDKPSFAIYNFERNFLTEGFGIGATMAQVLSRLLIAIEFSIALLLLMPFYVKKVVIPGTILLLGGFSIHLAIQTIGGDSSNCGCFGSLIEMTPLESLIKNLLTIAVLILPITIFRKNLKDKPNIYPVLGTGVIFIGLLFVVVPMKDLGPKHEGSVVIDGENCESGYGTYFEDIDQGDKLLCFFSPTCEHCQETGKRLKELKEEFPESMPEIRIIFMDESGDGSEADVKYYFDFIGTKYPYIVLSVEEYIPLFFGEYNFPGLKYLHNGCEKLFFEGIEDNAFDEDKFLEKIKE